MAPVQVVPSMVGYNSFRLVLNTQLFSRHSLWLVVYIFSYLILSTQLFSRAMAILSILLIPTTLIH